MGRSAAVSGPTAPEGENMGQGSQKHLPSILGHYLGVYGMAPNNIWEDQ